MPSDRTSRLDVGGVSYVRYAQFAIWYQRDEIGMLRFAPEQELLNEIERLRRQLALAASMIRNTHGPGTCTPLEGIPLDEWCLHCAFLAAATTKEDES